jgi:RNA polymerase sigma-70 factor (ECF subfamily)
LGYRTVFNLFAIEGYSHQEIGELLGITESTSKSQLNRARSVLKEKITSLQLQTKITHG